MFNGCSVFSKGMFHATLRVLRPRKHPLGSPRLERVVAKVSDRSNDRNNDRNLAGYATAPTGRLSVDVRWRSASQRANTTSFAGSSSTSSNQAFLRVTLRIVLCDAMRNFFRNVLRYFVLSLGRSALLYGQTRSRLLSAPVGRTSAEVASHVPVLLLGGAAGGTSILRSGHVSVRSASCAHFEVVLLPVTMSAGGTAFAAV